MPMQHYKYRARVRLPDGEELTQGISHGPTARPPSLDQMRAIHAKSLPAGTEILSLEPWPDGPDAPAIELPSPGEAIAAAAVTTANPARVAGTPPPAAPAARK